MILRCKTEMEKFMNLIAKGRKSKKIPGEQTVQNILDACNESYLKLDRYFNISSDYCIMAIVLDPRFKLDFYHNDKWTIQENEAEKARIWKQVETVYRKDYARLSTSTPTIGCQVTKSVSTSRIFKKLKPVSYAEDELKLYLMEYPRLPAESDPIEWWKCHTKELPSLSRMARDYLSIAGTSERAFSGGRRLITDTRSRLGEKTIRACMCLKSWLTQ